MSSNNLLLMPETNSTDLWRQVALIVGRDLGLDQWGSKVNHVSYASDTEYAHTITNQGAGGKHLSIPGILTVQNSGITASTIAVTGALSSNTLAVAASATIGTSLSVGTTLSVTQSASIGTTLSVGTDLTVGDDLIVTDDADIGGDLDVNGNADIAGNLIVGGTLTVTSLSVTNLTVTGNTALGDANTDTVTVIGVSTFRNATNTATQLKVDAANNRVIAGSGTALGSDTTPNLQVIGRLYVAPESANDFAYEVRRSSATSTGWRFGVESTNTFIMADTGSNRRITIGDTAAAYGLRVENDLEVSDDARVTGNLSGGKVIAGATTPSGGEELRVVGQSRFEGATEVTTGGLLVAGGAIIDTITVNGTGTVFSLIGSSQTQTTVGAAGGSSALPANPAGYIKITVGGTDMCYPYYLRS